MIKSIILFIIKGDFVSKKKFEKEKTLVIDSQGRAINVIGWQEAICLVYLEKVTVFNFHDTFISSAGGEKFQLPSVLQVKGKSRLERKLTLTKINIFKRDKYKCAYCGEKFTHKELTLDHIHPISRGGNKKSWDNLITSCGTCNNKKSNKLLNEINISLLFKPFEPNWSPKLGLSIGKNYPEEWENWLY
jgi:5-methylcytosine-specific restriction endonuclease McrA